VNLANKLCKITFSKFSVKSFLAKPLSDHLSDLTTHSRHKRILLHSLGSLSFSELNTEITGQKFYNRFKYTFGYEIASDATDLICNFIKDSLKSTDSSDDAACKWKFCGLPSGLFLLMWIKESQLCYGLNMPTGFCILN